MFMVLKSQNSVLYKNRMELVVNQTHWTVCSWLNRRQALSWSSTLNEAPLAPETVPFRTALGNGTSMYFRSRTLLQMINGVEGKSEKRGVCLIGLVYKLN